MLKQTVKRPSDWNELLYFGDEESLVNLGSFDDVIHRPTNNPSLGISVSWAPVEPDLFRSVSFSASIVEKYGGPHLVEFCYATDRLNRKLEWTPQGYRFISSHDSISVDLFRCYGVLRPNGPRAEFASLSSAFEDLFSQISYLGPLREHPRHHYMWDDHPDEIWLHGEKAIPALLLRRVQQQPIDNKILEWLKRLEIIDSYRLEPNLGQKDRYELYVTPYSGGPEVRLTDVGFGVSQVLPVLILCYYAPEGSILILEQPEAPSSSEGSVGIGRCFN